MSESGEPQLIQDLLQCDGIEKISIKSEVTVSVRKVVTDEVDDMFNEIRERTISEDELESIVSDTDWNYLGTIDSMSDYHDRDRFTMSKVLTNDD